MNKHAGGVGWIFIVVAIGFITNALFPSIQTKTEYLLRSLTHAPTPTPIFTEQSRTLTQEENATMSGSFFNDFSEITESRTGIRGDVAGVAVTKTASAANTMTPTKKTDTTRPTVKINGGPTDSVPMTDQPICFPLIIADNETEYTKLLTQASLDSISWTGWGNDQNFCFDNVLPGLHTFIVRVKDERENTNELRKQFTVTTK